MEARGLLRLTSTERFGMRRLRLVLAEDHDSVREGLRLLFETRGNVDVVQDVSDGQAAVEAVRLLRPDVVVLDLSMPGMSGLTAARIIRKDVPNSAIVALTRHKEHTYLQEMLEAGAAAYVLKQSGFAELLAAVNSVAGRADSLDGAIGGISSDPSAKRSRRLRALQATERERTVLRLSATGMTNKEIAAELNISVRTVEVHKAAAMRKLRLRDRTDVIRFATINGWLQDS